MVLTCLIELHGVILEAGASRGDDHMSLSICALAQFFAQLIGLQCQLSNGDSCQGYVCLCVCLCKSEGQEISCAVLASFPGSLLIPTKKEGKSLVWICI